MHRKEVLVITSDGVNWKVTLPDGEAASADSLEDLDKQVQKALGSHFNASAGDTITVTYLFDDSTIPEWVRQYSDHYFNRVVEFKY